MGIFSEAQIKYLNSLEGSELCAVCKCRHSGCHGLTHAGTGPVFPRCSEFGYQDFVDPVQLEKAMRP